MTVRKYTDSDIPEMLEIWNEIVKKGIAFPQEEILDSKSGAEFFASQTHCGVCEDSETGRLVGMYILHPNNVGRCGHICNASYAVKSTERGKGIGKALVLDCLKQGKCCGFEILQFNAVVSTNTAARRLYESLGFEQLGTIKNGFRRDDGYSDICPYWIAL